MAKHGKEKEVTEATRDDDHTFKPQVCVHI